MQVRDLSLALSHARAQVEGYRQQQVMQQRPGQELLEDLKRLKVCEKVLHECVVPKGSSAQANTDGGPEALEGARQCDPCMWWCSRSA